MTDHAILLIDSHHGQFIPQIYRETCLKSLVNYKELINDLQTLKNNEDEWYWEAWYNVLDNAKHATKDGKEYFLYQDGDLWAIPVEEANQIPEY
jgi:hypothetical protein